jgi:hypothetical protein
MEHKQDGRQSRSDEITPKNSRFSRQGDTCNILSSVSQSRSTDESTNNKSIKLLNIGIRLLNIGI